VNDKNQVKGEDNQASTSPLGASWIHHVSATRSDICHQLQHRATDFKK